MTRLSIEGPQRTHGEDGCLCFRNDTTRGPLLTLSPLKGDFKQVVAEDLSAVVCKLLSKALLGPVNCAIMWKALEGIPRLTNARFLPDMPLYGPQTGC